MLRFPYGNSDFYQIITEKYLYLDRTDCIPLLEEVGKSLLFLRPRRFGKSLLLSTLENYYDIAKADDFPQLFGHLTVGQNPTALHNQYLIMRWDFSLVAPRPTYEQQLQVLTDYINDEIIAFTGKYRQLLPDEIRINPTNAASSFHSAISAVQQAGQKLYLLIDEYDNFANEVLMGDKPQNPERYEALVFGEGEFKSVFKAIKGAMAGRGLDRTFIVGVSPIVLHDVSSGYNIAENLYFRAEFNALCGFMEQEVADLLGQVVAGCNLPAEKYHEALDLMRTFYNGSLFSHEGGEPIYNPTSTFYFLKDFQRTCRYPREMLDSNLAPDYQKLEYVSRLPGGEEILLTALEGQQPLSVVKLEDRFGIHQMLAETNTQEFMQSLLYYLGVLTLDGGVTPDGELMLRIPNLVMKQLYADRLRVLFLPNARDRDKGQEAAKALYSQGEIQPLCDFMEQRIFPVFDNRDYIQANELTIKTAFLTLLFNDTFYMIDSETELHRGYADLTMILRPEMRQFTLLDILLEFKFVKVGDLNLRGQLVRTMDNAQLLALTQVKAEMVAARTQAQVYSAQLTDKHGEKLKLRAYAVVAIGFERLVWEAVEV